MNLFQNQDKIGDVFCKALAPNDDSGRHGVLIPVHAYHLFPNFSNFDPQAKENYEEIISTKWLESSGWADKQSKWKYYHRYPERRITSLSPELLNNKSDGSLLVIGKYKDSYVYECIVVSPESSIYNDIGNLFNLNKEDNFYKGSSIIPFNELYNSSSKNPALDDLVKLFKSVNNQGFIETMRDGDTGVGYTFESLIGINANSSKEPDYKGIEIKCSRSKQEKSKRKASTGKQTLFSLVPNWDLTENRIELVKNYGYIDESRNRQSIYCTIKVVPNSLGWNLRIDEEDKKIYVCKDGNDVVSYSMSDLCYSLENKHKESVFITAHSRKNNNDKEEFYYDSLVHCKDVLFSEFLNLIKENLIGVDFAIHYKDGKARDHGFLWRLENKKYLFRLFKYVQEIF